MPLTTAKPLLDAAYAEHYAVPHFNVCNLETVQGVAAAAADLRSPVIFGIHTVESDYAGTANIVCLLGSVIEENELTAAIHLDHGPSLERAIQCIRAGYTSVMFDGSTMPLAENLAVTEELVRIARAAGVSVEAEVGTIGTTAEYGGEIENPHLADPEAAEAMAATGIDALAVAIGNAHGVYIAEPALDLALLERIRERTRIPLVLHGGSGIPAEQIRGAIALGIAKLNIGTAIHVAFSSAAKAFLARNPESHSLIDILGAGREAVRAQARAVIEMVGSDGRA